MGLDIISKEPAGSPFSSTVHIWTGSYGTYMIFREAVVSTVGGFPELTKAMESGFQNTEQNKKAQDEIAQRNITGLAEFVTHSDSSGKWTVDECATVKAFLESVREMVPNFGNNQPMSFDDQVGQRKAYIEGFLDKLDEYTCFPASEPPNIDSYVRHNRPWCPCSHVSHWFDEALNKFIRGLAYCVRENKKAIFC